MSLERSLRKKLEAGEISQEEYDDLIQKIEKYNLTGRKDKVPAQGSAVSVHGSKSIPGGKYASIKVSGSLRCDGSTSTSSLKVSGRASFDGDIDVAGPTSVSGKVSANGKATFGEGVKLSGKMVVSDEIVSDGPVKVAGKLVAKGDVMSSSDVKIAGKLESASLKSSEMIKVVGKLNVENNVIAKEFVAKNGGGRVGGNLHAERVDINFDDTPSFKEEQMNPDEIDNFPSLAKYLTGVVKRVVNSSHHRSGPQMVLEVFGDIEGDSLELDHVIVHGKVTGSVVRVGENFSCTGGVFYRELFESANADVTATKTS